MQGRRKGREDEAFLLWLQVDKEAIYQSEDESGFLTSLRSTVQKLDGTKSRRRGREASKVATRKRVDKVAHSEILIGFNSSH